MPKRTGEGHVTPATLIYQVTPVYPNDAKKKHIRGPVTLNVTIEKDSSVENPVYESGPPMLMSSAIEAVKKWRACRSKHRDPGYIYARQPLARSLPKNVENPLELFRKRRCARNSRAGDCGFQRKSCRANLRGLPVEADAPGSPRATRLIGCLLSRGGPVSPRRNRN
jgi:hypothetical protein